MENAKNSPGRRKFLRNTAAVAGATALGGPSLFGAPSVLNYFNSGDSLYKGVTLGLITYSFRSMPDQSAEGILGYINETGIQAIELMGDPAESYAGKPENPVDRRALFSLWRKQREGEELSADEQKELNAMQEQSKAYNQKVAQWRAEVSPDKFKEVRKMYEQAGVKIYAFKPNAFGTDNTDAEIDWGFRTAKILGASHVTLEHPSDDAHTKKLGAMAKKHGVYVAYHGHEQQTPTFWDTALDQSAYNALNLDLGHYVAAGNTDPLGLIRDKNKRIMSMHLKDRQTPAHGKDNLPWGTGDTPIARALQLMKENGYGFPATIELEYDIPEGSDAVTEVKKCLAYCQDALS
jgi:sugar phosphate isomerase/epimerase